MKECVTHYFACDCREARFRALEQEAELLRAVEERARVIYSAPMPHDREELGKALRALDAFCEGSTE